MKILIVEDEPATARRMQKLLLDTDEGIEVSGITDSIESTVSWLRKNPHPDLIFMDIQLADGESFEIFREVDVLCPVVFTTAYDKYAIEAFKVNSIDYLLKPVEKDAVEKALAKFRKINTPAAPSIDYAKLALLIQQPVRPEVPKRMLIRYGDHIKAVEYSQVAYFYTIEKQVFCTTFNGDNYPAEYSLDKLNEILDPEKFFRVNRSFIVNYDAIDKMISWSKSRVKLTLKPPTTLDTVTSTDRSGDFKRWLTGRTESQA
ncbi:MAG: response regulator transcription factor [Bacteroidales bacterium]|nr:response regulator transcription factor [Bacteroidales bacterium]